jgi:hypothetical protein
MNPEDYMDYNDDDYLDYDDEDFIPKSKITYRLTIFWQKGSCGFLSP